MQPCLLKQRPKNSVPLLMLVSIVDLPKLMRDFAPGALLQGHAPGAKLLRVYQRFHGILHPREQNFHPAKCSTIFNRLNVWEQAPGANRANLKTLPRVYWHVQNDPGAKPLVCFGLYSYLVPFCFVQFYFYLFIHLFIYHNFLFSLIFFFLFRVSQP